MSKFKFELIGHDVEFIVRDVDTNLPVSMSNVTQETLDTCVVYPDNVLLEVNTDPTTLEDFPQLIKENLEDVTEFLESISCYVQIGESSACYPSSELCDPKAHEIGCLPFHVAYTLGIPLTPMKYTDSWRFAGGHIHLAYDKNLIPSHVLVRMLDEALKDKCTPDERRDIFYGQRGAYREKAYGLEYRSLSNYWLSDPQALVDTLKDIEARINEHLEKH